MLCSKRCLLSNIQKSDFEEIKELYVNKEVRKYLGGTREEESIKEAMEEMIISKERHFYWTVREKHTGDFIALVSLDPHHIGDDLEVSYQFLPRWWGAGYAAEAVQEVIEFAFHELNLPRVIAVTQMANAPSRRLLEKLGMELIDTYERFGAQQGVYAIHAK